MIFRDKREESLSKKTNDEKNTRKQAPKIQIKKN